MKRILLTLLVALTAACCDKIASPRLERGELELTRADLENTLWHTTLFPSMETYDAEGDLILQHYFLGGSSPYKEYISQRIPHKGRGNMADESFVGRRAR